jgi:hypothetical protein
MAWLTRCRDCKYYSPGARRDAVPTREDYVEGRSGTGSRLGSCARWHYGYGVTADEVGDHEVVVENDEGWGAAMGPDFGCLLWEAK